MNRLSSVTLQQLRIFASVANERSFVRGAERVYLSQPTASDQIKLLENLVGFRLFERSPGRKQVELTEPGRILLQAYYEVSDALERAESTLDVLRGVDIGTVTVGGGLPFCCSVLPPYLEEFQQIHPGITVRIQVDQRPRTLRNICQHLLDLAVEVGPVNDLNLVSEPLCGYALMLVGPPGHRLAGARQAPFRELASERLILPDRDTASRQVLERMALETGTVLNVVLEINDANARSQAVANGLGIALVGSDSAADEIVRGSVSMLQIRGFPVHMEWHVVHRRGPLPSAAQILKEYLLRQMTGRDHLAPWVPPPGP